MPESRVPTRDEIAKKYTWNAESLFVSDTAWEIEVSRLGDAIAMLEAYQGRLQEGPGVLADCLEAIGNVLVRIGRVVTYAGINQAVNTRDQQAAMAASRGRGLMGRFMGAYAFLDPELLALGRETVEQWIAEEPRLRMAAHYVDDLFRQAPHVRSAEVEQLMGMVSDAFQGAGSTHGALTDADFVFAPAVAADGTEIEVTQGSLQGIYAGADREARRTAYEHYTDVYLVHQNTLASTLETSIKQNVFRMRARRYDATLTMALGRHNIPVEVFHNLITTFRANLPTWHRYWAVRRQALGLDTLAPYDVWAPLTATRTEIPFGEAIDRISEGLAPMGTDYVATLRRGALAQRWIDVYPTQGKGAGAFSAGFQGTYPFIVLNYNNDIFSLSTLAHELGHSMHSYLTWETQPFLYSDYSLFVAEVASNFHQAMVRAHLLETSPDAAFEIGVIEEAMSNFHRYFFIMPTLARFELEMHERVERGQGLSAAGMIDLMADLFAEGYGDAMTFDRERVGITWATFGHLYVDYYVYQYATGISGANALAQRILRGEASAVEDYLSFLRAGGSLYPLDALKLAGVDLATPEPVEVTFGVLGEMVDRLEKLVAEA
ncbi:MAG: oligoendopeptidase F [Anaerolineae bacterium]|nr:oligoendopeptidase F [Anaerolineae bacterium]